MKKKAVISLGAVVGLAALSAAAFASTADTVSEKLVSVQKTQAEAGIVPEKSLKIAMNGRFPMDLFSLTESAMEPVRPPADSKIRKSEDVYLLAKIAMAEAEGEDIEGKALVMLVVLNRVKTKGFPDSIEDVIYQTGQFSPVASGRFDTVRPDAGCWQAFSMIEQNKWDKSMGATYFESESESTWHEENLNFLFRHGSHYFYMDRRNGDE